MSIDVIKFDWELCDKIDEILNKHKVKESILKKSINNIMVICTDLLMTMEVTNG